MNELIHDPGEEDIKTYETLILQRDKYRKEAAIFSTLYQHEFGELITAVFQKKIDCIEKKKMIAYCQASLNRGEVIDQKKMRSEIASAMKDYYAELEEMIRDRDAAKVLETSPAVIVEKTKRKYHALAKLIHPDIHPELAKDAEVQELWNRIVIAYGSNDLEEMEALEILVHKYLDDHDLGGQEIHIRDIRERIEAIKASIEKILSTDPYQYKYLLDDKDAVVSRKQELQQELEEYAAYEHQLEDVFEQMVGGGFTWQIKN